MSDVERIELGHIQGAYGLKGWVKLYSETRPKENIFQYSPWLIQTKSGWKSMEVRSGKPHGKTLIAHLEGCDTRDDADALIGCKLAINADQLDELDADEYYWHDLIACSVVNLQGDELGKVKTLHETGGHDVMSVVDGHQEHLIPFVPDVYVKDVDLDNQTILVDWERAFSE